MPTLRQNYEYLQYQVHTMIVALNTFNQVSITINEARDAYERIDKQMQFDLASPIAIRTSIKDSLSLIGAIAETNGRVDSAAATIYRGWTSQVKELLDTPESKILITLGNSAKPTDKEIRCMITERGQQEQRAEEEKELGEYQQLVNQYERKARYHRTPTLFGASSMKDEGTDDGQGEEKVNA